MSMSHSPNEGQLAKDLPGPTTYLTGHDASGKAVVEATRPGKWQAFEGNEMAFNLVYTNQAPPDLNGNRDIETHDHLIAGGKLGLVNPGGTVMRMVDFAPQYECIFHRTQSLDFGIVMEGSIEMILDDRNVTVMRRGDVAVQRATVHAWRNPSKTEWTRMYFVLQDCKPLTVAGKRMGEDLGRGTVGLPPSGNDTTDEKL